MVPRVPRLENTMLPSPRWGGSRSGQWHHKAIILPRAHSKEQISPTTKGQSIHVSVLLFKNIWSKQGSSSSQHKGPEASHRGPPLQMHAAKRVTDVQQSRNTEPTEGRKQKLTRNTKTPSPTKKGGRKARFQRLVLTHPLFVDHLPRAKLCSAHSGSNRRVAISLPWWTIHCGGAKESE